MYNAFVGSIDMNMFPLELLLIDAVFVRVRTYKNGVTIVDDMVHVPCMFSSFVDGSFISKN